MNCKKHQKTQLLYNINRVKKYFKSISEKFIACGTNQNKSKRYYVYSENMKNGFCHFFLAEQKYDI